MERTLFLFLYFLVQLRVVTDFIVECIVLPTTTTDEPPTTTPELTTTENATSTYTEQETTARILLKTSDDLIGTAGTDQSTEQEATTRNILMGHTSIDTSVYGTTTLKDLPTTADNVLSTASTALNDNVSSILDPNFPTEALSMAYEAEPGDELLTLCKSK